MESWEKKYDLKGSLIDKVIEDVYLSDDRCSIIFKCKEGLVKWYTVGDCCSESWIEHITLPHYGMVGKVLDVREVELGKCMPTRQEVDQLYGLTVAMEGEYGAEELHVEFRNSSNGYYGGSMLVTNAENIPDTFTKVERDE